MSAQNAPRLARIGSPGSGISIAEVFGIKWLFDLTYAVQHAVLEFWNSCLHSLFANSRRCIICDDQLRSHFVACSNDKSRHWYCLKCFERTITAMITGDVAFSYDPRTTLPLCCYCRPLSSSTLDIKDLSLQMRRSWDRAIMARQLQALGVPLITCTHCSYVVLDERSEQQEAVSEGVDDTNGSLRQRLTRSFGSFFGSSPPTEKAPPGRFHCPECDFLTCLPPQGCGAHFQLGRAADEHECRTDDLRLEIERAVDKSLIYTCPRCSMPLVKDGGCNHCTCPCGAQYCHICHAKLGRGSTSIWRSHFCDHFIERGRGKCTAVGCRRCPLYSDRDDEGIRRRVEGEVTRRWRRQRVWSGIGSLVGWLRS